MLFKKLQFLMALLLTLSFSLMGCRPGKSVDKHVAPGTATNVTNRPAINDEQEFRSLFKKFKIALAAKNIDAASEMLRFPFFTSYNQQENGMGAASDPISYMEFADYSKAIFNDDVLSLLPKCKEDNLSEIDGNTNEHYYKSLKKITDPGSKMYEAYLQYPEAHSNAESFFGFVFGRVNGKFKAIAVYAKWPVK